MARRRSLAVTLLPLLLLLFLTVSQPAWASSAHAPSPPLRFASPSAALCSELDSCARCLTNSSCVYCAYEGQQQGDGLCLERTEGGAAGTAPQCSEPDGTLIKTADQCAAAADDTCESRSSCDTCATAPLALHCGWCASIGACVSGTVLGPDSGVSCGAAHSGWGYQLNACTAQALCNKADRTNCSMCLERGSSCGWCDLTGRCETGGPLQPVDLDCSIKTSWYFGDCELPAVDRCDSYSSCLDCENAPAALSCGWCDSLGACMKGNLTESLAPLQCPGGNSSWTYQSCPSDVICHRETDCSDCAAHPYCVWCTDDGGSCLPGQQQPIPSASCSTAGIINHWQLQSCPNQNSVSWPAAARWGLACLVVTSVLFVALLLTCAFPTLSKRFTPVLGSRIGVGGLRVSDFSRGCRRFTPVLLVACILALKLPALMLDQWDAEYLTIGDLLYGHKYFGCLNSRKYVTHIVGGKDETVDYARRCAGLEGNNLVLCRLLRAAGGFTLGVGVLSAFCSVLCLVLVAVTLWHGNGGWFARHAAVPLWRLSILGWLSAGMVCVVWTGCGHVVLFHVEGDQMVVGVSLILFLAAVAFEILLALFMRRAVTSTPDMNRGQHSSFLNSAATAGVQGVLGYMYVPQSQQQQQPLMYAQSHVALTPQQQQQLLLQQQYEQQQQQQQQQQRHSQSSSSHSYHHLGSQQPLSELSNSTDDVRVRPLAVYGPTRGGVEDMAFLYPPVSSASSSESSFAANAAAGPIQYQPPEPRGL